MRIFLLLCSFGQVPTTAFPDRDQLANILGSSLDAVNDFTMYTEGEIRFVDDLDPQRAEKTLRLDRKFQSLYVWRRDDSIYLDLFTNKLNPKPRTIRRTFALFQGRLTTLYRDMDQKGANERPETVPGEQESVSADGGPHRFLSHWFWRKFATVPDRYAYEPLGWETRDGSRCLRFKLRRTEFSPGSFDEYLVDLDKNGAILEHEMTVDNHRWFRVSDVKLRPFTSATLTSPVWFPVHAVYESFINADQFLDRPVMREVYDVVSGSLAFNLKPSDRQFSVTWDGSNRSPTAFRKSKEDYDRAPNVPAPPRVRSDPEGVRQSQAEKLVEAEREGPALDASPSPDGPFSTSRIVVAALFVGGSACLGYALISWRKNAGRA